MGSTFLGVKILNMIETTITENIKIKIPKNLYSLKNESIFKKFKKKNDVIWLQKYDT